MDFFSSVTKDKRQELHTQMLWGIHQCPCHSLVSSPQNLTGVEDSDRLPQSLFPH